MGGPRLYLASRSPRRRELLRQIGIEPVVCPTDVDEGALEGETPERQVCRLARAKAHGARERLGSGVTHGLVLGADTAVVLDDRVLGKPADDAEAFDTLRRLRGRSHHVWTGVCLARLDDGREAVGACCTRVDFRDFDDRAIRAYVAAGEPRDKAGSYGIQGRGVLLVREIEGSWSNVVGLPLERLPDWMGQLDIDVTGWLDG